MPKKANPRADAAPPVSDDPSVLDTQAREAIEKNASELRARQMPIATEPPTVYRP
ncbi:MAG TPA: hypothetical protein VFM06_00430 [Candidatus Limnocylindria bacterium]|nr:hypothetical protein [Candidatus Limnocylindria bacterium]